MDRILAFAFVALLIAAGAPTVAAQGSCGTDSTSTYRLVPGFYVRTSSYQCSATYGTWSYDQRVNILRIAEEPSERVVAQMEIHSIATRYADGREARETFVALRDSAGLLGYTELEYKDTRANGACHGAFTLYRGGQTSRLAGADSPTCLPALPLMP